MIAAAYIIPIIASLLLHFEFNYTGSWTTYLWLLIFGEGTVGALHWWFYDLHTSRTEYLGSLLKEITYEEPWTELIEVKETKTDSKGNSYTVSRIEERHHREKYYFHNTRGSRIDTNYEFYSKVRDIWNLPSNTIRWKGTHIKGGVRYGTCYKFSDFDVSEQAHPKNWIPITESNSYRNKVQASNSIFKFEKIEKETAATIGLLNYPNIYLHDAPCVLSNDFPVNPALDILFRKFNAVHAPDYEMRLYILLYKAERGIGITERQRAYWQGGNKNEFVVCAGLNSDNEIEWARTFSWADEQTVEANVSQWLMNHPKVNWEEFHDWLRLYLMRWKRKEFKDFDYINVTMPLWQILSIIGLSIAENAFTLYIIL